MDEQIQKRGMSPGGVIGIAVIIAIIFGGGAYMYVSSKAKKEKSDLNAQITELRSQVAATSATATATATATAKAKTTGSTTATATGTVSASVSGEAAAKEFCQGLAGSGVTVTISKYENISLGEFASCGYENATTITKNVNGTWTKIWRGNGDMTCELQEQYGVPNSFEPSCI